ncbi:hypothetical protein UFOVP1146_106 [uncultured Caudovirales phage]|uniref:PAAR motif n=1 Tax=uncultured Caudovirales phage TaxID=2100421 RepID=A0A6J5SZK1_9CAUD|nr:hypothetical protein UFOVP812_19 [uncultured Caudovirales phage]CAB4165589.1 hypothetical protein UFOVP818_125 [uncultured Caudovirales phage]CAB4186760.1 hypothetical protein UFOVP1146_106 [uncultured Caudovirales phage]CAB4220669.1 hypothetical protein UFOVP1638_38 [uncultured Caudovirales phage]
MAGVQREGDMNLLGGISMGGDSSVLVNGRAIAIPGMRVFPHLPCGIPYCSPCQLHCFATTKSGSGLGAVGAAVGSYFFGPIGAIGGRIAGGIIAGAAGGSGVFVNGKPIIVDGDMDSCICPRQGGSSDVNIG